MNANPHQSESPWPHRWAVALVCATFPMIWIGGLVTTYGAGMAVPDWPTTYGYNPFAYPLETWLYGPWKLFIEHGHRLFGTLVGMITIGFMVSTWWCQRRASWRWLGVVALGFVLFQGVLGGLRVIQNEVQLAQVHGVVGPAFFAFTVALAAITSRRWQVAERTDAPAVGAIERLALVTVLLAFCQLVLGTQLRHLPAGARPGDFRLALFFHLAVAAALLVHIVLLAGRALHSCREEKWLVRPAAGLLGLILLQLALGGATWVTKYGWPAWMASYNFAAGYVTVADGALQAATATAHVAIGSGILATSLLVALRAWRLTSRRWPGERASAMLMEAVA